LLFFLYGMPVMSERRSNHTSERRFAAEEWVMPEDELSHGFRIALPRATPA
jgi:hypothetical protein